MGLAAVGRVVLRAAADLAVVAVVAGLAAADLEAAADLAVVHLAHRGAAGVAPAVAVLVAARLRALRGVEAPTGASA